MSNGLDFDFKELIQFKKSLMALGKLPQKVVTRAAGKGATVAGRAVRAAAPRGKTKQLSKGIKRAPERSRTKGKKVYHYAMDPAKTETVFRKPIKNPGESGGKRRYAYYPASVEYGFLTRSKGGGLTYVQGKHFARDAAEDARPNVEKVITSTLTSELDKEWKKKL